MHRMLYLGMFGFVQFWTILIHDGDMISGHLLERFINSPAHHTLHHLYFTCNYGQYFTWADKAFDSHRDPCPELDPLVASLKAMKAKGLIDQDSNPIPDKAKKQ
jgi:lathosterol oxidase